MDANHVDDYSSLDRFLGERVVLTEAEKKITADKELFSALEKFKAVLKREVPAHHFAHVKVWSIYNNLYDTISEIWFDKQDKK